MGTLFLSCGFDGAHNQFPCLEKFRLMGKYRESAFDPGRFNFFAHCVLLSFVVEKSFRKSSIVKLFILSVLL